MLTCKRHKTTLMHGKSDDYTIRNIAHKHKQNRTIQQYVNEHIYASI